MEETKKLIGNIDKIVDGIIFGWVYDKDNIKKRVHVQAIVNSELIGEGTAENYRSDLQQAKVGDGHHAFTIKIIKNINADKNSNLELFDAESKTKIQLLKNSIQKFEFSTNIITKENLSIENHVVRYSFRYKAAPKTAENISFFIDKILVFKASNASKSEEIKGEFLVAKKYLDGNLHILTAKISTQTIAKEAFISQFHFTPWEHLKADESTQQFASLTPLAKFRYESLVGHLNLIDLSQKNTIQQLSLVHEKLVEGFEKNRKFPTIEFPKVTNPKISIIIPAHNQISITYHCLCSLLLAPNKTSFEVILVDDASTDQTTEIESFVKNISVVRNKENLLFLKSCNHASTFAKGEFLVFLNNDTEVTKFWLDELMYVFENHPDAGLVGSKLLNANGSLQEAGGVIWKTGTPWNVGYGQNAYAPEFNFLREADYVSGASMAISKSLWEEVGKFSLEFAPAYYEDTDLAFKVRAADKKVYYTPFSQVIHFEGMSNGKDVTKGIKKYQKVNEKTFKKKWAKDFKSHGEEGVDLLSEINRAKDKSILIIDYQTPQLNNDAGSYAAIQEIKILNSLGFKVTFIPENLAFFAKHTHYLQRLGVEVIHAPFAYSVNEVIQIRGKQYDAVYITRYNVAANYIDKIRANSSAKIIFNNADLHFLRELRSALRKGEDLTKSIKTRDAELEVMRKVDVILSYNEVEHAVILSHNLKDDNIFLCPWVVEKKPGNKSFSEKQDLVFLGNFNHPPNFEGVEFMAKEVMPKLALKDPSIKLKIFGSNINDDVEALASDNVEVIGFAEDLDEMFNDTRIFVAPLLSGAGIKGKVLEAMAHCVPTIMTPVAAEGTKLTNKISTLIAKNADEWVEQILSMYNDEKLWKKLKENACTIVDEEFSFEKGQEKFKEAFESVDIFV